MAETPEGSQEGCFSTEVLKRLTCGEIAPGEELAAREHLNVCEDCRRRFDALFNGSSGLQAVIEAYQDTRHADQQAIQSRCQAALPHGVFQQDHVVFADGLHLVAPRSEQYLARLGAYDVISLLGRGGMGYVFKGYDAAADRYVALKVMRPELSADVVGRARFLREARAAARLQHPHIVTIYAVSPEEDPPFFVMECLSGVSLASLLDAHGPLSAPRAARLTEQLLLALEYAHQKGIIHRDIKPPNVLVDDRRDFAKLVDFGLARAIGEVVRYTGEGQLLGTTHYMSPEQARGDLDLDGRSDLFSVGVVLFEMLTRQQPFRGEDRAHIIAQICHAPTPSAGTLNPAVPPLMDRILARAMQKVPNQRYRSAREFMTAIQAYLATVHGSEDPTWTWKPDAGEAERSTSGGAGRPGETAAGLGPVLTTLLQWRQSHPAFQARVWVQTGTPPSTRDIFAVPRRFQGRLRVGDRFALCVQADRDCYVTLVDVGATGNTSLLLQNQFLPAGPPQTLQGPDASQEWIVGPPTGIERIKAVFALQPLALFPETTAFAPLSTAEHTRDIVTRLKQAGTTLDQLPVGSWTDATCEFLVVQP